MKYRRAFFCVLLALLLILTLAPAAFAEVEFAGDSISGEHDATVFLAGSDPVSTATVKGILFGAGNTVSAGGESEYAFLAGNNVALNGDCSRDAFIAGNNVGFAGNVARDLYAAGNLLTFHGTIGRDFYAGGKMISLGGEIGGDVYLDASEIQLADDLKIGGSLRYNASANITGPKELISGAEVFEDTHAESESDSAVSVSVDTQRSSPLSKLKSRIFGAVGLLLIAYFFLWLTPLWEKIDSDYTGADFGKYAAAFGIGLGVLLALPIAAIILMITGIGLRPAFVLLCVYIAALIASPIFLGFILGSLLWRKAFKQQRNYWAELAIGIVLLRLVTLLPYVPFFVTLVSAAFGLGCVARLLGKKRTEVPALPEQGA